MKNKIRPIYNQLQGLLGQVPPVKDKEYLYENDKVLWERFNESIDELNSLKVNDYLKFKIEPKIDNGHISMSSTSFRTSAGSLISRLHGDFFADEPAPFSGSPSTVISQTQFQTQHIALLLEMNSFVEKKLSDENLEQIEKNFLQKIKEVLPTVKTSIELMNLIFTTAHTCELNLDSLQKIFR